MPPGARVPGAPGQVTRVSSAGCGPDAGARVVLLPAGRALPVHLSGFVVLLAPLVQADQAAELLGHHPRLIAPAPPDKGPGTAVVVTVVGVGRRCPSGPGRGLSADLGRRRVEEGLVSLPSFRTPWPPCAACGTPPRPAVRRRRRPRSAGHGHRWTPGPRPPEVLYARGTAGRGREMGGDRPVVRGAPAHCPTRPGRSPSGGQCSRAQATATCGLPRSSLRAQVGSMSCRPALPPANPTPTPKVPPCR